MKTTIIKNANYIGWVVIVLAFALIYFSYFFVYIPKKEVQLQQKGFRILKEYGSNMLDKQNYFENHFKNYGIFYSIRYLENKDKISKKSNRNIKRSDEIEGVIKGLQPYVNTTNTIIDSSYTYSDKNQNLFLSFYKKNTPELIKQIKDFYESAKDTLTIDEILTQDYTHTVPINDFMDKLKFDGLFENIILFDEKVVSYNSKIDNLAEITNPKALRDSTYKHQGGIYKMLDIRGKDKHAMILPIDFVGKRFFIAGFISDTDFRNKTRTINKQLLIFIAGFLLLIFAGMPILKIILIDDKERLITRDASGAGISLLFGVGLFVLLIIAFSKKQFVDQSIQKQRIQNISDTLYSNITNDINSIINLGTSITKEEKSQYSTLTKKVTKLFNSTEFYENDSTLSNPFPLNEIFLISDQGYFKKGYTRTPFSDIVEIDLSQRQYFRNIRDINKSWHGPNDLNFYIESIKSFNTGKGETAISFNTTNFNSSPVLAITSVIPSLYHQVLPKDIEFVIINKKGKVLYHSIEEKNLHENFVLECESNLTLINAINLNAEENIQINYNEKKWLARIVPIENTPLYHITLLDLNRADNLNARIFLFTFYFLMATLIFIVVGLLIVRWITLSKTPLDNNNWFLNWMVLQPCKYRHYINISYILIFIISMQLAGLFIITHPVAIIFYQFIFIVFTLFVSMIFLNRKNNREKSLLNEYFIELTILLAFVLLSVVYLLNFEFEWHTLPILSLIIIIAFIFHLLKKINLDTKLKDQSKQLSATKIKRIYLIFLSLWLSSISAMPVVTYYFSIKQHEGKLWKQELLQGVAQENIELQSVYSENKQDWFKRVQGNGIDNMNISYLPYKEHINDSADNSPTFSFVDEVYNTIPDPITIWYNQPKLISQNDYVSKLILNDTLYFKKGLDSGAITANQTVDAPRFSTFNYITLILFILIIIATCTWFLLKYLAYVLLNLKQEKPVLPEKTWFEIIQDPEQKRILLNSFDGVCFLKKSIENFTQQENNTKKIETFSASQILAPNFKIEMLPKRSSSIIWISEFNQIIYDFDKHEKLLSILNEINQNNKARIIVDLGFNFDIIHEFYDDLFVSGKLSEQQQSQAFLLQTKWKTIFDNYHIYNGYLNQANFVGVENIRVEDNYRNECKKLDVQIQLKNIWSTLSSNEKILLYDLAVDGLINRKNKAMIQKLVDKRLIIFDPYPSLFSDEFRSFVLHNLKLSEVKSIERKLGIKGSWHNAKYLILLTVIPLAALVIISQNISIEKVFGIFAGGLAILTGIMRLFDSNFFKQAGS